MKGRWSANGLDLRSVRGRDRLRRPWTAETVLRGLDPARSSRKPARSRNYTPGTPGPGLTRIIVSALQGRFPVGLTLLNVCWERARLPALPLVGGRAN
jgi:hypothetical protein